MAINYYVLDTETTGLKADYHEINQISIQRLGDNFQKTWNIAVDFPERASQQALDVQKKTKFDLKRGQPKAVVVSEIDAFFDEDDGVAAARCIIGHNISFDRRFLHRTWVTLVKEFKCDLWLCTQKFMKAYGAKVGLEKIASIQNEKKAKFGLDNSLKAFGIVPKVGAHSATVDVQNNRILFDKLMDQKLDYVRLIERIPHKISGDESQSYDDVD